MRLECPLVTNDARVFHIEDVIIYSYVQCRDTDECWDCFGDCRGDFHEVAHLKDGRNFIVDHIRKKGKK